MAIRRFEKLTEQPVRVFELDVVGRDVRTREDAGVWKSESCASDEAAQARAGALVSRRTGQGYVEIKRMAAATTVAAEPVHREREVEWQHGLLRHFRVIRQRDHLVTLDAGHIFRIGRVPLEHVETRHLTVEEASEAFDKLVAQTRTLAAPPIVRRNKSARALEALPPEAIADARDPVLEAECRAAGPDDAEPWRVYADWLIAHGDPRGDIAGLALGGRPYEARAALESHYRMLWEQQVQLVFELRHGFARRLQIAIPDNEIAIAPTIARLLASPLCTFVDDIDVEAGSTVLVEDWTPTLDVILASPHAAGLRALRFGRGADVVSGACNFSHAWAELPSLETLVFESQTPAELGTIDAPKLVKLVRRTVGLDDDELAAITRAAWPALAHFELGFTHRTGLDPELGGFEPILEARAMPALRHLGIVGWDRSREMVVALSTSRLLPQLQTLDLSRGYFDDVAAGVLVSVAPAFRHLATFDLRDGESTEEDIAAVRRVLDNVLFGTAIERDDEDHYDDIDE